MVEKDRVNRLTDRIISAEGERDVRNPSRDECVGEGILDRARCLDVVDGILIVRFDTSRDREDVRIEDDILRREADACQDLVGAGADPGPAFESVSLPLIIESHHDCGSPVPADRTCAARELVFPFLQADRVDDSLTLEALQPRFDPLPVRRVDHDGNAGDVGFCGNEVQESNHRFFAVKHGFIHVDVDHLSSACDLIARDLERLLILRVPN